MREVSNPDDDAVRERLRTVLGEVPADPAAAEIVLPDDGHTASVGSPPGVPARAARRAGVSAAAGEPGPGGAVGGAGPGDAAGPSDAAGPGDLRTAAPGRLTAMGAFDPGRRGMRALAAVAAVVVLIAGFLAWRARPQVDPVPAVPAPVAADLTGTGAASAGPAGEVVVAVGGKVRRPGLVRLPGGSRVADALQAAGGARPGVDPALLNLARKVVDGELIMVGVSGPPGAAPGPGAPAAGAPGGGGPGGGGPVNLNTATLADLDTLPGVGPVLAQRILAHREQHGGFRAVGDLRKVDGIGSSRFEQLKDLVTV